MTIENEVFRADYDGPQATDVYAFGFRILTAADLRVIERDAAGVETVLTLTTHYTVAGIGNETGGTITRLAGNLPAGVHLTIRLDPALKQQTDLRNQGGYFPEVLEDALDYLTNLAKAMQEEHNRKLGLPETSTASTMLPNPAGHAGKVIGVNGTEDGFALLSQILGFANPMVAPGDLPVGGVGGAPARLALGPANRVIRSDGAAISWGQVLAPDFRRFEGSAENAGVVTVTTAMTTIVTVDCGTVATGDRIYVRGQALLTKGATGGQSDSQVFKASGTAVIQADHDEGVLRGPRQTFVANDVYRIVAPGMLKVTTGGTLTLGLAASSAGSDSAIGAGAGQLYAWVIPGA